MIIGIAGAIGSGKSFTQLKMALHYCEVKEKQLVTNFDVDIPSLIKYCQHKKYKWCIDNMLRKGAVSCIINPSSLQALFIPASVVCLDEAGIFLNSRDFMNTPKELLADLCQSRKTGVDLIWAAQFEEQVDKQVRLLTQYWIHCDSVSVYNKQNKRPELTYKRIYWFTASDYFNWVSNIIDRGSHFKARFAYSFKYEGGFLDKADKEIFNCFQSLDRLDMKKASSRICTLNRCDLSSDYLRLLETTEHLFPGSIEVYRPTGGSDSSPANRAQLIGMALALSRKKGIRAPMFKALPDAEIKSFLLQNS